MGLDNGPDSGPESGFYKKERGRSERSRKMFRVTFRELKNPKWVWTAVLIVVQRVGSIEAGKGKVLKVVLGSL